MIAIQCRRAFDGEGFSAGEATVLIDGGTIVDVQAGTPELGEQWQVLRYPGATILPGLIDTHAHLVGDSRPGALDRVPGLSDDELDRVISEGLQRQLAAGVTLVRDLGDRRFAVVDRRDRERAVSSVTPAPTILASGPPLTSPGGHCFYLGGEVEGPAAIAAAIRERVERRVDVVKVMASGGMTTPGTDVLKTQFSTDHLRLIVDQAHAAGLPVAAHAHGVSAVEQSVAAAVDSIEHCSCLTENGFRMTDELIDRIASAQIPVSGVVTPSPTLDHAPAAVREMVARSGLDPQRLRQLRAEVLRRMHHGGIRIVTGVDSGLSPWLAHGNLHIALALLAESGFTPAEVLAAATSHAAEVCGVGDRKGRLRAGYDADVIVVDTDVTTEVRGPLAVRATVLGGRVVSG